MRLRHQFPLRLAWCCLAVLAGCAGSAATASPRARPAVDDTACRAPRTLASGGHTEASTDTVTQLPLLLNPPTVLPTPPTRPLGHRARVVAGFVVDTLGHPVPCSWHVISFTDEVYVPIAYRVIMALRYSPGRTAAGRAPVLVQQAINW